MTLRPEDDLTARLTRICLLALAFLGACFGGFCLLFPETDTGLTFNQGVYLVLGTLLLAALFTRWVASLRDDGAVRSHKVWYCPLVAAGLTLAIALVAYAYLGVWPLGSKTVMVVDMHHQYAPLLSELRQMLLEGDSFTYSFHLGLGANFIPAFAYYLASPLNLLLLLFPPAYLAEGIFVIILLKTVLAAAAFAACAQYLIRRRNATIIALSLLYALMTYMLAYSWNVMWLDVVVLTPVVVLCAERMLRGGGILPYALTLGLALFCNYYLAFMLCVFLVLYFVVWAVKEHRRAMDVLRGGGRFALGSLLGGGLAASILIPTALALGRTSAAGGGLQEFAANFDLFDLGGTLFYGATPTIRSGNLPNLYCGVLVVLLLPLYLTMRPIPLRRRLCYGGLAGVLLLSCTVNQWDLLWHGLHTPNDLPYRFSFLVCFVLLLLAGQVLRHLSSLSPNQVLASLGGCVAYLILWEKVGGDAAPEDVRLYTNLLLLALYAGALLLTVRRKFPVQAGRMLILLLVAVELTVGSAQTLSTIDANEYYTAHEHYVDNPDTEATAAAIARAQALAAEEGERFVRMDYLPRSTCMDTALHHYSGLTTFASSNPYETTLLMGDLGYAVNGVNSYLFKSFVASADSLFGIRYVVLDTLQTNHPQLTLVDRVQVNRVERYIYRNELALPVGFYANTAIRNYTSPDYAPFKAQEALYNALTGVEEPLYEAVTLESDSASSTISGSFFAKSATDASVIYSATIAEEGQYFAYVDCRAAESISVNAYGGTEDYQNGWSVTTHEPYIIDMGVLEAGSRVDAYITGEGAFTGNVYVMRLLPEGLQAQVERLQAGGLQLTDSTDTSLTGTLTAPAEGTVFFSIPYDKGWTVTVDGSPVETFPIVPNEEGTDGALLGAVIPAGQHTVEATYRAPGQTVGLIFSLLSVLAAVALWLIPRFRRVKLK
ncbi:MAG: hypothetical protein E7541_00480 [Ruminococcaceae bacterium]|nr:hypothetical protein [Oscillospiraceae bacterium]